MPDLKAREYGRFEDINYVRKKWKRVLEYKGTCSCT